MARIKVELPQFLVSNWWVFWREDIISRCLLDENMHPISVIKETSAWKRVCERKCSWGMPRILPPTHRQMQMWHLWSYMKEKDRRPTPKEKGALTLSTFFSSLKYPYYTQKSPSLSPYIGGSQGWHSFREKNPKTWTFRWEKLRRKKWNSEAFWHSESLSPSLLRSPYVPMQKSGHNSNSCPAYTGGGGRNGGGLAGLGASCPWRKIALSIRWYFFEKIKKSSLFQGRGRAASEPKRSGSLRYFRTFIIL